MARNKKDTTFRNKSGKEFTAAEINQELGYGEGVPMKELVGETITITGAKEIEGQYGRCYRADLSDGTHVMIGSMGIMRTLDLAVERDMFPLTGKITKGASKKRKGKFFYSFE